MRNLLASLLILGALAAPAMAAGAATVTLDGEVLLFDQPPAMVEGRLLVPMRRIFEALGADVVYTAASRTITATSPSGTTIELPLGGRTAYVNGAATRLDVPATVLGGRTLVPLRFVSEAMGADVQWDASTRTVAISSGGASTAARGARGGMDVLPRDGSISLNMRPTVQVNFGGAVLTSGSVRLFVDARELTSEAQLSPSSVRWIPNFDLSVGTHTVQVEATDTKGNLLTRRWSFHVDPNARVEASLSVTNLRDGSRVPPEFEVEGRTAAYSQVAVAIRGRGAASGRYTAQANTDGLFRIPVDLHSMAPGTELVLTVTATTPDGLQTPPVELRLTRQ